MYVCMYVYKNIYVYLSNLDYLLPTVHITKIPPRF